MAAHKASALRLGSRVTLQALAMTLLVGCAGAPVETPQPETAGKLDAVEVARLESAFWACDYVATTRGMHATPIAACRYATEELKQHKFGGSSSRFVEWWRENKAAEHRRLGRLVAD